MSLIPKQADGGFSDNEHRITCNSVEEAKGLYSTACRNLLGINEWGNLCNNLLKAQFALFSESGLPIYRLPKESDFIRINLPGPGPINGDGYDWVQIEKIVTFSKPVNDEVGTFIRVRPVSSPLNEKTDTAHFFSSDASSTFMVKRVGTIVIAEIHGRNEKPNTDLDNAIDNMRNTVVATLAIAKLSDIQWKNLCEALLTNDATH